jgi:GNAT superfamily N-acetyltransferase
LGELAARFFGVIEVVPFSRSHQAGVIDLVLSIQRDEFGVPITVEDQPDLLDIPGFYQQSGGNFWVAIADGEVVGTIALRDIGHRQGALRKMFVKPGYRGKEQGVARRLLDALILSATSAGISDLFLGTIDRFVAAHRFYEKNGFVEVPAAHLPKAFPLMGVDTRFYHRKLG